MDFRGLNRLKLPKINGDLVGFEKAKVSDKIF